MNAGNVIALVSVSLVFCFGVIGLLIKAVAALTAIKLEIMAMRLEVGHVSRRVDRIERTLEDHGEVE